MQLKILPLRGHPEGRDDPQGVLRNVRPRSPERPGETSSFVPPPKPRIGASVGHQAGSIGSSTPSARSSSRLGVGRFVASSRDCFVSQRFEAREFVTERGGELRDTPPLGLCRELGAELETYVADADVRSLLRPERARRGAAERAPRVIAARRLEVARRHAGELQRRDLGFREQIECVAAAAPTTLPAAVGLRAALRAAGACVHASVRLCHLGSQRAKARRARNQLITRPPLARLRGEARAEPRGSSARERGASLRRRRRYSRGRSPIATASFYTDRGVRARIGPIGTPAYLSVWNLGGATEERERIHVTAGDSAFNVGASTSDETKASGDGRHAPPAGSFRRTFGAADAAMLRRNRHERQRPRSNRGSSPGDRQPRRRACAAARRAVRGRSRPIAVLPACAS